MQNTKFTQYGRQFFQLLYCIFAVKRVIKSLNNRVCRYAYLNV